MIILALILWLQPADSIGLDDLHRAAIQQFPLYKNLSVYDDIRTLNLENLSTLWYPEVSASAFAQYQSAVTQINVPIPGFQGPAQVKDRYGAGIDIRQLVWDGGITKARQNIEALQASSNQQEVHIELYHLRNKINELFFSGLILQYRIESLNTILDDIRSQLELVRSRTELGILLPSTAHMLEVELLEVKQHVHESEQHLTVVFTWLSELTGMALTGKEYLFIPGTYEAEVRPEYILFETQHKIIDSQRALNKAYYLPKINAFGSFTYARPGLDMFEETFSPNLIFGINATWQLWNWNTGAREREVWSLKKKLITHQREHFDRQRSLAVSKERAEQKRLLTQLELDEEIRFLRDQISEEYASKLAHGVITPTEYLSALHQSHRSRLEKKIRELKLIQTEINIKTIIGESL